MICICDDGFIVLVVAAQATDGTAENWRDI